MTITWQDFLAMVAACAAGGVIGLERDIHDKPAGLRTNILICLGAALFTIVSVRLAENGVVPVGGLLRGDRTRIAAQIVTGVGFLGAGAILHTRLSVIGLTTAATIWTVASIGMAFGAHEFVLGGAATVLVGAVLFGLARVEALIARWYATMHLNVLTDGAPDAPDLLRSLGRERGLNVKVAVVSRGHDDGSLLLEVGGPERKLEGYVLDLMAQRCVKSVVRS